MCLPNRTRITQGRLPRNRVPVSFCVHLASRSGSQRLIDDRSKAAENSDTLHRGCEFLRGLEDTNGTLNSGVEYIWIDERGAP